VKVSRSYITLETGRIWKCARVCLVTVSAVSGEVRSHCLPAFRLFRVFRRFSALRCRSVSSIEGLCNV
jgi:hypothetical protein